MPEHSQKKHQKHKNYPKEQRRGRQRTQDTPVEQQKKDSKTPENPMPGPEFYNNLKRETDEILKITEEENAKYKKKEIQSNWAKYEMPIETYDEIQEQENIGADFEKLMEAPVSLGGHFQFKHEKSWNLEVEPSPYGKYFEINMEDLYHSITTLPLYERNNISRDILSDIDILNMNDRATKAKQKYYNDKSFRTPETDMQDKALEKLCSTDVLENNTQQESNNDVDESNLRNANSTDSSYVLIPQMEESPIKVNCLKDDLDNIDDLFIENRGIPIIDRGIKKNDTVERIDKVEDNSVPTKQESQKSNIIESPEDLEKWLDDFLED